MSLLLIKLIVVIIAGYHYYQLHTKFYRIFSQGEGHTYMKLLGITCVGFDVTDQLLIRSFRQILEKKWEYNETVRQLFVDFTKAHDTS
jgi:hypothetical protein